MIRVFTLEIRWYAFIIVSAIIISLIILYFLLKKDQEFDFEFFLDFLIIALPVSIVGARLYYVLFKLDYYLNRPFKILAINEGGLAIHGGLLIGIAVLYLFCKKKEKNFLKALDYLAPLTAFSQSLGRWGNFINQEAYGKVVNGSYYKYFPKIIKKQMYIKNNYREPTFLYESIANFLLFSFLLIFLKTKKKNNGEVFSLYLIFYSLYRYFVEERRTDSLLLLNFKIAQLMSLFLGVIGLGLLIYLRFIKNDDKS